MALLGPTDRFVNAALNALRGTNFTAFNANVGFCTTPMTSSDGTGATELSGTADYARKPAGFAVAASRQMANSALISFIGSTTGQWNGGLPIPYFGIWDAGGLLWWVDEITPAFSVGGSAINVSIPLGSLILRGNIRTV